MWYQWQDDDLLLWVTVQSRAGTDALVGIHDDALKVKIKAAPVDGKANQHLIKFLAKIFDVAPSHIQLLSGHTNRRKRLRIADPQILPHQFKQKP
ncbi:MAG: DUF167 family protein [Gammaproteobacteria bacterium]|nr:DUF167 family protein [Gammaproteobacteria bacterium]MDH5802124.1 DUF167 family protein [Gammaproteobacteria bacterium]